MTTSTRILAISALLALVPAAGRAQETDLERDLQQWSQPAEAAPQPVQPGSPVPAQPPPPPPAYVQDSVQVPQALPPGQWVFTSQYGWVWMPFGNSYVFVTASAPNPLMYLYYPAVGWCWVAAPWVWGWGPMPYFGVAGPWSYRWWGYGFGRWHGFAGPYARWAGRGYWHGGHWYGSGYGRAYAHGYAAPYRGGAPVPPRAGPPAPRGAGPMPPHGGAPVPHQGGYAGPHGGGRGSPQQRSFVSGPKGFQPSARATFTAGYGGTASPRAGFGASRGGGFSGRSGFTVSHGGSGGRGGFGGGHGSGGHR